MASLMCRLHEFFVFVKSMLLVNFTLLRAGWRLTKLKRPSVTIFGGARLELDSEYSKKATQLSQALAEKGVSIVTGGGPGIMEAANLGAHSYREDKCNGKTACKLPVNSFGISLSKLNKEKINPYVQDHIVLNHFFERKWLLMRKAAGFVIFPGGFGTMDEFFELLTLIQCNRMPRTPVVLFGEKYWNPILDWVHEHALKDGMIQHEDASLISVTDDVDEALTILTHMVASRT